MKRATRSTTAEYLPGNNPFEVKGQARHALQQQSPPETFMVVKWTLSSNYLFDGLKKETNSMDIGNARKRRLGSAYTMNREEMKKLLSWAEAGAHLPPGVKIDVTHNVNMIANETAILENNTTAIIRNGKSTHQAAVKLVRAST